jgi:hypothetical protein
MLRAYTLHEFSDSGTSSRADSGLRWRYFCINFFTSFSRVVASKREVPRRPWKSLEALLLATNPSAGNIFGANSKYSRIHSSIVMPSVPSIIAISPPVDVPAMRSKNWHGFNGRFQLESSFWSRTWKIRCNIRRVERPRTPPPSRESSRRFLMLFAIGTDSWCQKAEDGQTRLWGYGSRRALAGPCTWPQAEVHFSHVTQQS